MFKNYFKIAVRNLTKQKGYTAINVVALGIGMGICLFLVLLDFYALNFDTHHENSHRIYRLADIAKNSSGSIIDAAIISAAWDEAITNDFHEVESFVRFSEQVRSVGLDDKVFRYGVDYMDESILNAIDLPKSAKEIVAFLKPYNAGLLIGFYFLEDVITDEYTTEEAIGEMLRYFTCLTIFGVIIAVPLASLLLNQWLNSFPYSTGISVFVFLGAGVVAVSIAMLTVS